MQIVTQHIHAMAHIANNNNKINVIIKWQNYK